MPELPEVETTRRGVEPHCLGRRVEELVVRESRLRWPVPADLPQRVKGQTIDSVERRGKYLLINLATGTVMVHLGMSGSLRVLQDQVAPGRHDHIDIVLQGGHILRYNDPRRFGVRATV